MTQERIALAGFASIAALIVALFGWTRADPGDWRTGMSGLRSEIRADMNMLRTELRAGDAGRFLWQDRRGSDARLQPRPLEPTFAS